MELLKSHFDPEPSAIVSRCRFNSRVRKLNESVAEYVAELRSLAGPCKFGNTIDDMVRDRLVCGINEPRIQRLLLQEPDTLKYEDACKIALALETADRNAKDLQQSQSPANGIQAQQIQYSRWTIPRRITVLISRSFVTVVVVVVTLLILVDFGVMTVAVVVRRDTWQGFASLQIVKTRVKTQLIDFTRG